MKRLLPLVLMMVGVLCMSSECNDGADRIVNRGVWLVKNDTGVKVWIKPGGYDFGLWELGSGEEIVLTSRRFPIWQMPEFGSLRSYWSGWAPENIYFSVLSETGTPLREWKYTEAENAGRHFFAEQSWTSSQSDGERADEIDVTWVFTIRQTDVVPLPTAGADAVPTDGKEVRP